jgi:hypothetical protein
VQFLCALLITVFASVSILAQEVPATGEKKAAEPVRVPVVKCTRVCDRPLGSPNLSDRNTWTNRCETKCEPERAR